MKDISGCTPYRPHLYYELPPEVKNRLLKRDLCKYYKLPNHLILALSIDGMYIFVARIVEAVSLLLSRRLYMHCGRVY